MPTKKLSVFDTLNKINVNEFKEKKGSYDYLSWSDAVQYVLTKYPDTTWETHEFDHPSEAKNTEAWGWVKSPYMITDAGCFVKVSVTIDGITRTEIHAIMDNRNQAIPKPTATQVNNSIKRCLVKCFALFGLALYIYRGEDLPEDDKPQEISKEQNDYLMTLLKGRDKAFIESIQLAIRNKKLNTNNFEGYVEQLKKKKPKKEAKDDK
jgi:hypothetical protein